MVDPTAAADEAPTAEAVDTRDAEPAAPDQLVEADLLVEDVSIDGMCGVY
jgi:mycofactocin precursor